MVIKFITDFLLWFILLTSIWIIINLIFKHKEGFQDIGQWNFKEISGIPLIGLSVSSNSKYIWGIQPNNKIVYREGIAGDWKNVDGSLKQISVSKDGKHVWGVNRNNYKGPEQSDFGERPEDLSWKLLLSGSLSMSDKPFCSNFVQKHKEEINVERKTSKTRTN